VRARFRLGDVASHDDEVVLAPIPTDHELMQDRLVLEPVALDQSNRLPLVRCHLRHDFFDTKIWRYGEDLLAQQSAEPTAAVSLSDLDAKLTEVALPANLVVVHARVTDDFAVLFREHSDGQPGLDVLCPVKHDHKPGDVDAQELQIVLW